MKGYYSNGKKVWSMEFHIQKGKGNHEIHKDRRKEQFKESLEGWRLVQNQGDYFSKFLFYLQIISLSQVIYEGKYKFGKKYGRWNTQQRFSEESKFQQLYVIYKPIKWRGKKNFNDNGMKQGNRVELCSYFQSYIQITYSGDYQDGLKIGKWTTMFREYSGDKFREIGGGSYDLKGVQNGGLDRIM
ncbi:unnamed protein product (macronuclear) [Paramecium tetraurelia]|uniref:Jacalin-type lectin domain-containing protein n=1 Tax=Paramecium tetraurelia TaxID=5888 RepID=A0CLQ7_PARTE|nr:uncharacterized protein GSPATT00038649001 [Paramecium tetraurelia]CAK71724.1 unnamed protein product [Paramecium tetraurelia]|eukprot:XP_001439121.1 hypothetical protein (macronuclear) [Paramecium tetraurelia strain d4-2]